MKWQAGDGGGWGWAWDWVLWTKALILAPLLISGVTECRSLNPPPPPPPRQPPRLQPQPEWPGGKLCPEYLGETSPSWDIPFLLAGTSTRSAVPAALCQQCQPHPWGTWLSRSARVRVGCLGIEQSMALSPRPAYLKTGKMIKRTFLL